MEYIFLIFGILGVGLTILGVILIPILYFIVSLITTTILVGKDLKDMNKK